MEFEKRGVPATVIVTDNFEVAARQILKSSGYSHVPVLVTPYPVAYLTEPEIHARVNDLIHELIKSLCDPVTA